MKNIESIILPIIQLDKKYFYNGKETKIYSFKASFSTKSN